MCSCVGDYELYVLGVAPLEAFQKALTSPSFLYVVQVLPSPLCKVVRSTNVYQEVMDKYCVNEFGFHFSPYKNVTECS